MGKKDMLEEILGDYLNDVLKCVRCGFCNSVCPTSNASFSYKDSKTSRGRIVLLQAKYNGVLQMPIESDEFQELMDMCFGCRRCLEVCPASVRIPQVIWRAKSAGPMRLNKLLFANYGKFEKLGATFSSLSNLLVKSGFGRSILEAVAGIERRAPFPTFHGSSLEKYIRERQGSAGSRGRLAYFIDVFTNYHDVELGKKTVTLLEEMGYSVEAPRQREAGTLALECGALDNAIKIARFNVDSFYESVKRGARIITTSPAAYVALKIDYPELLGDEKSRIVADNTLDVIELLLNEHDGGFIDFAGHDGWDAVYHHSCFTKASHLTGHVKRLLDLAGYRLVEFEECCGVAGVWGLSKKHYEEAREIGSKLFAKIVQTGLPVFSQSETCRLQLRHHTGVEVKHPLEGVLDRIRVRRT